MLVHHYILCVLVHPHWVEKYLRSLHELVFVLVSPLLLQVIAEKLLVFNDFLLDLLVVDMLLVWPANRELICVD